MEKRELTCIGCPLGCQITVTMENGEVKDVAGYTCARGEKYAREEVTNPTRTVTSIVRVEGGNLAAVSVKTKVCGCDLKAISYFASYLPLIEDRKFKPEQHIRVLSNTRPYPGGMEYENSFGGVKYRLPYLPIVEEQAATLKLLEPLSGKEAKSYEPVIAAIAVEVFGDGK